MPYTAKANRFFRLCSSAKGRAKAHSKCPPMAQAKKMAQEGIKRKGR